jgi:hypothetical protein
MNPTCEAKAVTLRAWADIAKPGERRIYFTGFLARAAMDLQEAGVVHLFQQRVDEDVYAYIAQRRR